MSEMGKKFIVGGLLMDPPCGLDLKNWLEPGVVRWKRPRRNDVTEIIVHESVTRSTADTVSILDRKGLSVHVMHDPSGETIQHGDLLEDWLYHGGAPHNKVSVGLEIVTPYYPEYLKPGMPWGRTINAPWAHKGQYVLPTMAQAESLSLTIDYLTSPASGLSVPKVWIGLDRERGRFAMGRVKGAEKTSPGIYAHHYFGHSDGAFPVLYSWLRIEAGLSMCDAYAAAIRLAEGAKGYVDVSEYLRTSC